MAIFISHIPHVMELGDEIGVLILFHCPFSTTLSPSSLQNTRPYEIHPFLVMYKPSPSFIEDMSIQVIFFILGDFSIHVGDHTQHLWAPWPHFPWPHYNPCPILVFVITNDLMRSTRWTAVSGFFCCHNDLSGLNNTFVLFYSSGDKRSKVGFTG